MVPLLKKVIGNSAVEFSTSGDISRVIVQAQFPTVIMSSDTDVEVMPRGYTPQLTEDRGKC